MRRLLIRAAMTVPRTPQAAAFMGTVQEDSWGRNVTGMSVSTIRGAAYLTLCLEMAARVGIEPTTK